MPLAPLSRRSVVLAGVLALAGCSTAVPEGITAVTPFDATRYAGKWFEIARLDHSFERGLGNVSATYTLQADGSVQVLNRGYNNEKKEWKQAEGRALFTGSPQVASLKVSFFGPFYGGYHVVQLDADYRWALVVGADRSYAWILARDKQLPAAVRSQLLAKAQEIGIAVDQLVWVDQSRSDS
ncbi:apolipoprotein D and lipocalin family protein [Rhodoferax sp. OV413]|uniref:lipocalin family protein n=1 Tax=Rhodoferax sp. OV413 TaxID=1855285 RepID=UPI00088BBD95|nr:lipocalin family protein [Rhodoferax sp. OV413]SDP89692.1 apolipoprotein D and lipocalin family protein [Rhodoferax sp. OV413]